MSCHSCLGWCRMSRPGSCSATPGVTLAERDPSQQPALGITTHYRRLTANGRLSQWCPRCSRAGSRCLREFLLLQLPDRRPNRALESQSVYRARRKDHPCRRRHLFLTFPCVPAPSSGPVVVRFLNINSTRSSIPVGIAGFSQLP